MLGRQKQHDRTSDGLLSEIRQQRTLLEAIALEQRKIRRSLTRLGLSTMALPELIEEVVKVEIEEGMKVQALAASLQTELDALKAIHAATPTPGVGEAIVNIQELKDRISAINPTPLGDAIVSEVVTNPEIETPAVVESAPPVAPEVIQSEPVVSEALDAIVSADAVETEV